MGALLSIFGAAAMAPAAVLRLKALIIGVLALAVVCLALTTWALFERSGRLELKVEVVTAKAQTQVWEAAAGRCTASVQKLGEAGTAATAETKRLLALVEKGVAKTAALRDEARTIVSRPAPARADGKPKDCSDAISEIRKKVQP